MLHAALVLGGFVDRLAPVLRLRAELDAAEEAVVALGDVNYALRGLVPANRIAAWFDEQIEGGRVPVREDGVVALPLDAFVTGEAPEFKRQLRAWDGGGLTVEQCKKFSKELAPLLAAARKELGEGAVPEHLPWEPAA